MNAICYIGLDIHKKTIAYCIKQVDGVVVSHGTVAAQRKALNGWLSEFPVRNSCELQPVLLQGELTTRDMTDNIIDVKYMTDRLQ
jgi:hypothetical protein